ncbi:MAG TPA: sulfotransferase domain-containing protein [Acidimicrobiia bacterium]|nr:sulfotransferase domain-containing protein [Acidimicrobiia bacterium]
MGRDRVHYKGMMSDSARWDAITLRADDIIITTPAKCGTTWTQMICALLILQTTTFDQPLGVISPWPDMLTRNIDDIVADLDAQRHRRFIKSHTPLDGLPDEPGITYIGVGRDPRDACLSWDNHASNNDAIAMFTARHYAVGLDDIADELAKGPPERPEDPMERFWNWMDDDASPNEAFNLAGLVHHLSQMWARRHEPNVILLRYEDLEADLEGEMRRLAARLGVAVDEPRWPELVAAASFANMRANADTIAPESSQKLWHDNRQFFNTGHSGGWQDLLDSDDVARYARRVRSLADPELVEWLHPAGLA